jgi:hypothetical protein
MILIMAVFGEHYLRGPDDENIAQLMDNGNSIEYHGLLGSIDCMH